jgi:hypothetical protein
MLDTVALRKREVALRKRDSEIVASETASLN